MLPLGALLCHKFDIRNTDVVTITHAAAPSGNEAQRDAIQNAVVAALGTSWTKVAFQVENLPYAVSAIAIA